MQGSPGRPEKNAFEDAYLETYGYPVSHPFMAEHYDATVLVALAAAEAGSTTDITIQTHPCLLYTSPSPRD